MALSSSFSSDAYGVRSTTYVNIHRTGTGSPVSYPSGTLALVIGV